MTQDIAKTMRDWRDCEIERLREQLVDAETSLRIYDHAGSDEYWARWPRAEKKDVTPMIIKLEETSRGFKRGEFRDRYGGEMQHSGKFTGR